MGRQMDDGQVARPARIPKLGTAALAAITLAGFGSLTVAA
jgi:hypothetical protein